MKLKKKKKDEITGQMALFVHNNANRIQFLYIWCKINCEKYVQKQTKIFSFPVLRLLVILSDFIFKKWLCQVIEVLFNFTFKKTELMYLREMATYSNILAWRILRTEEPDGLQSMGLQRVTHNWMIEHAHTYTHIHVYEALCCKPETNTTLLIILQ